MIFLMCRLIDVSLTKKETRARRGLKAHKKIYNDFRARLNPQKMKTWLRQAAAFDKDPSSPDPYYREALGTHRKCLTIVLSNPRLSL